MGLARPLPPGEPRRYREASLLGSFSQSLLQDRIGAPAIPKLPGVLGVVIELLASVAVVDEQEPSRPPAAVRRASDVRAVQSSIRLGATGFEDESSSTP